MIYYMLFISWDSISEYPNITWEIIKNNPDKPWVWDCLSRNPNINPNSIESGMKLPYLEQMLKIDSTRPKIFVAQRTIKSTTRSLTGYPPITRIGYNSSNGKRHIKWNLLQRF